MAHGAAPGVNILSTVPVAHGCTMTAVPAPTSPLRVVGYCRTSTDDAQSPEDSRRWQLGVIERLVAGHGEVVEVVHDVGFTRGLPWARRPDALAPIERCALPAAARGFEAIAVAEPQRAFGDPSQLFDIWRKLDHYGVGLWIPEVGGPADIRNEGHNIVLSTIGTMSESERPASASRSPTRPGRWPAATPATGWAPPPPSATG
jgi:hypothetical protein